MESLFARSFDSIAEILGLEKRFQARIVYQNLIKGVVGFDQMTSLPKSERERLCATFGTALSSKVIRKDEDGDAIADDEAHYLRPPSLAGTSSSRMSSRVRSPA